MWAFILSAVTAAAVWALSVPLTGKTEPWDAEGFYYFAALAIAGAVSAFVIPKHLTAHYAGAVVGQVAYELLFLEMGALFVLGLLFLMSYGIIFLGAAALVARIRRRGTNEATAV
jgi:hypothetical protein